MASLLSILLVLFAWLGHIVLWVAIVNRLHAYALPRKLIDLATLASGLLMIGLCWPLAMVTASLPLPWLPTAGLTAGPLALAYAWGCALVALFAAAMRFYLVFHKEQAGIIRGRHTTPIILSQEPRQLLAPGYPRFVGCLPGNQALRPILTELELVIPHLPLRFAGLRIAHLSDLHLSGRIGRDYLETIVDRTNKLDPDMVVVTGDIVEHTPCLDWVPTSLGRIASPAKLFVLGNHDLKVGPENVRRAMRDAGFCDVGSRSETIQLPQGECWVAGNETPWFGQAPILPWDETRPPDNSTLRLALVHTPDVFGWCATHRFHLALAGHNHGGQIRLPLLGAIVAPSRYGTRYASGTFRRGDTVLHVSQGTSSLAPLRYNCPPELGLLKLVAE